MGYILIVFEDLKYPTVKQVETTPLVTTIFARAFFTLRVLVSFLQLQLFYAFDIFHVGVVTNALMFCMVFGIIYYNCTFNNYFVEVTQMIIISQFKGTYQIFSKYSYPAGNS